MCDATEAASVPRQIALVPFASGATPHRLPCNGGAPAGLCWWGDYFAAQRPYAPLLAWGRTLLTKEGSVNTDLARAELFSWTLAEILDLPETTEDEDDGDSVEGYPV